MGLSTPGMGSGLDVKGMVEAMVKADTIRPQQRHDEKLQKVNTNLSAVGQLKSNLAMFQNSLNNLSSLSQFYKMKNSQSDLNYFVANVSDKAKAGHYQISVQKLAQAQCLASTSFINSSATVGSGSLTIQLGTYNSEQTQFIANPEHEAISLTIENNNSLEAICEAINTANAGVSAAIIQDSTGARLSLVSTQSGEDYALQITGTLSALTYDPTTNNATLNQTIAAQNSEVLINGMLLSQNSNHVDKALANISLDLKEADPTKTTTLKIDNNEEGLKICVTEFVKRYNDCMSYLNDVTSYNQLKKSKSAFQGDVVVKGIKTNLHQLATSSLANQGALHKLSDLGININNHGLLDIDQSKLNDVIKTHYDDIGALFAKSVSATDPLLQVNYKDNKISAGSYEVEINDFNPGTSLSGTIGSSAATSTDGLTLEGSNDFSGLSIKVLGGNTGNRGQIVVQDGLAVQMNTLLTSLLDKNSPLSEKTDFLNNQLTQLDVEQTKINSRSKMLEDKYTRQWNTLDLLISKMQSESKMLEQALANLPKLRTKN